MATNTPSINLVKTSTSIGLVQLSLQMQKALQWQQERRLLHHSLLRTVNPTRDGRFWHVKRIIGAELALSNQQ
eukprot:4565613-Amphidinium_carterae.2